MVLRDSDRAVSNARLCLFESEKVTKGGSVSASTLPQPTKAKLAQRPEQAQHEHSPNIQCAHSER